MLAMSHETLVLPGPFCGASDDDWSLRIPVDRVVSGLVYTLPGGRRPDTVRLARQVAELARFRRALGLLGNREAEALCRLRGFGRAREELSVVAAEMGVAEGEVEALHRHAVGVLAYCFGVSPEGV